MRGEEAKAKSEQKVAVSYGILVGYLRCRRSSASCPLLTSAHTMSIKPPLTPSLSTSHRTAVGVKGGKGEEERWEEREDFKEAKRERADASEGN